VIVVGVIVERDRKVSKVHVEINLTMINSYMRTDFVTERARFLIKGNNDVMEVIDAVVGLEGMVKGIV